MSIIKSRGTNKDDIYKNIKVEKRLILPNVYQNTYGTGPKGSTSYNLINNKIIYSNGIRKLTLTDDGRNRIYDAIVDSSGIGDFTKLSDAINAGKTNIYIRNGTYIETTQINITKPTQITGCDINNTIIIFEGLTIPAIKINNGPVETVGTISIFNSSSTVNGIGTTFTNLSDGDMILISQTLFMISTITNDTSLTLSQTYNGKTITGALYIAGTFVKDIHIDDVSIINSSTTPSSSNGIDIFAVQNIILNHIYISGFDMGISLDTCISCQLLSILSESSITNGIIISDSITIELISTKFINNSQHGLETTGSSIGSKNINITDSIFNNNGSNGILINGGVSGPTESVDLVTVHIESNVNYGIRTTNNTNTVIADQCIVKLNGTGIELGGSLNILSNCVVTNNTGVGISLGDKGIVNGNQCQNNGSYGMRLQGNNDNNISGNTISNNLDAGIYLSGNSSDNTISSNVFFDNTNYNINFSGGGSGGSNTITGNTFKSNSNITNINVDDDDNCITGNHISNNNSGIGINVIGNNTCITGNRIRNHITGINITATANDTLVVGNHTLNNTTGIINSGTGSTIANNK